MTPERRARVVLLLRGAYGIGAEMVSACRDAADALEAMGDGPTECEHEERADRAEAEVERLQSLLKEALRALRMVRAADTLGATATERQNCRDAWTAVLARARQEGFSDGD